MLLFFFSVKKKRRITLGRTYWQDNSSALSGISSRRGDLLRGKRHNNNINHLHKKYLENQHYKYRKRQTKAFAQPEADSEARANSAERFLGVVPRTVFPEIKGRCEHRPLHFSFQKGQIDSSALSGISSIRGDFLLAPLQRNWQAVGLTKESRANNVRPYEKPFKMLRKQPACYNKKALDKYCILAYNRDKERAYQ